MSDALPPESGVKRLQRKPRHYTSQEETSSAPEANLSREQSDSSERNSTDSTLVLEQQPINSYNESYLRSDNIEGSTETSSPLSVLNYDNYPSIRTQSDRSSAISNIDEQMQDLEDVYSKITSVLQISDMKQDSSKGNSPNEQNSSIAFDPRGQLRISSDALSSQIMSNISAPAEPPKAVEKPVLQMFNNATNEFTQIVTHDSVVPVVQTRTATKTEYKNIASQQPKAKAHSDSSYLQQEMLIQNLEKECDRLQKAQPKPPKDELEMNYQFELSEKTREVADLREKIEGMSQEFSVLVKENDEMRQVLQRLIAELHGEDVEIPIKQVGDELIKIIQESESNGQAENKEEFYEQRIQEAVVDLEAMKRLVEEKQRELDRAEQAGAGPGVELELQKRDKIIQDQLLEMQRLQTELFEAKTTSRQDTTEQTEIEELNELLELAQLREKEMEQQQFENQKNYERFADERIDMLRTGYEEQIEQLQNKLQRSEQDSMRAMSELDALKEENERLKISQKDDRIEAIENKIEQQPLSNQLMERAVLAEKTLREERERFERSLAENQRKLEDYEEEIGTIIDELERLL